MKLRVSALACCLVALAAPFAFSQAQPAGTPGGLTPDKGEIESARSSNVVFVSYEGPSSRIDSLAEIKGIGASLGAALGAKPGPARAGDAARYAVIRAIDLSVKEGLDADIIVLGADAQIDHIRNLRWIVAGYLASAWGYSEKDAYTLATFITIYNAVHRGDLAYFASKYKAVVQRELAADNAGLALNYAEWPGKSRIVIPLSAGAAAGKLGAVSTGAVSDKAVVDSLKAQADKGVADRQALVDVKEREAAQNQAAADKAKADLAAAEKALADAKAAADAARAAAAAPASPATAAAPAGSAATPAAAAPAATGAAAGAATAPAGAAAAPAADLTTKDATVKAADAAVAAAAADVAAKKDAAAAADTAATAKKAEAAADRKDITADQKAVIAAEVATKGAAAAAGIYLVRVGDDANHLGQIVFVDADKGATIRSSRLNTLHLRSLAELGDAFVAVAGLAGKAGGVKLERLDKVSLESVAEGKADMFPESAVYASGDLLYAVVAAADGKYYLGAFAAADLSEKARSKDAVAPYTFVSAASGNLAAQSAAGTFILLKPDTLEKVKDLKP